MASDMELPCSDEVVKEKTGKDWAEWCEILDEREAAGLAHKDLARMVNDLHEAGGWWSQTVAVGYGRLRGKRVAGQKSDGSFSSNASKTLPVAAREAHAFFTDPEKRRRWLSVPVVIRKATAPKSVRITWPDRTSVEVWITGKDDSKCSVAVEHTKLGDREAAGAQKTFWKAALQRLAEAATQT